MTRGVASFNPHDPWRVISMTIQSVGWQRKTRHQMMTGR